MFDRDQATNLAMAILEFRRLRATELSGDLFSDPAWDLLLELFIADARGLRLTGREISRRSGVSPRVVSIWLRHMGKIGLILGDGHGELDDLLTLSPEGVERMERVLKQGSVLRDALVHAV